MSFFFNGASGIAVSEAVASAPLNLIVSYPFTISCWFFPTAAVEAVDIITLRNTGANNSYWLGTTVAGTGIRAVSWNGTSAAIASITSVVAANRWHNAIARFGSNTSRTIHINGGTGTTNNTDSTQTTQVIDTLIIGKAEGEFRYVSGYIAHVAIWNIELQNADSASLGRGVSPLAIRRQNLVAYWPMVNPGRQINIATAKSRGGQALPMVSGARYSNWNAPVKLLLPPERKIVLESPAAQNNAPIFYHQRQQQGMAA